MIGNLFACERALGPAEEARRKQEVTIEMPSSAAETKDRSEMNPSQQARIILEQVGNGNLEQAEKFVRHKMHNDKTGSTCWQSVLSHLGTIEREAKRNDSRLRRMQYVAINIFLVFHILAIACWCVPIETPLIPLCKSLVQPYFLWAGLFQSWDTFAPIPKGVNTYIEAVVVYEDGSRKTWTLPRMEQLSCTERYFKERYRKFAENLVRAETDALLPDAARYIARSKSSPAKPVKTVILIQNWSFIVPRSGSYVPAPWDRHILLGYGVRPEDLK